MATASIPVRSSNGEAFTCHLALPEADRKGPAVVLASSVRGVDADLRAIAEEFAAHGFIAAAPELFWRSPPTLHAPHAESGESRIEQIRMGERDMAGTLEALGDIPGFNRRAIAMGFCYGGPYAILGPKRLGYAAGVACHGSRMLDFIDELDGVEQPVALLWGDADPYAPSAVLAAYRQVAQRRANVEMHVFPGVGHSYMMRRSAQAFDQSARDFSMARALAMLERLRT